MSLSWDDPGDSSVTGYQVLRRNPSVDERGEFQTISNDTGTANTSYVDNTVAANTRYFYRVRSRNSEGLSPASSFFSASVPAPAPTPAPTPEPTPAPTPAPTPEPGIDYDEERTESVSLGDITNALAENRDGSVNTADPVDYFHFSLTAEREVGVRIRRLDHNADLHIEDNDGTVIASSENSGDQKEVLNVTLTANNPGEHYYVRVEGKEDGQNDYQFRHFAEAPPNTPATGLPTIRGNVAVGTTLTADTSGISDGNGITNPAYVYQWMHSGGGTDTDITGATGSSHSIVSGDAGNGFKVRVSFTDDDGYSETLTSNATDTLLVAQKQSTPDNVAATGAPTITGTVQVGQTLTADTSGISDGNGLTNAHYTHQWVRGNGSADTDITDATGSTYTLTDDDLAHTIKVRVSFTDDDGYAEELTSAATGVVNRPPNATATGLPAVTGTVQVGETLGVDTSGISDANGITNPAYGYQWMHSVSGTDTDISGATTSSYTIVSGDAGNGFKVRVSFTDDDGYSETLTSDATDTLLVAQEQQQTTGTVSEPSNGDFPGDSTTSGSVAVESHGATGYLSANDGGTAGDGFKIYLEAGKRYRVDVLVYAYRDVGNGGTYEGKPLLEVLSDNTVNNQPVRINGLGEQTGNGASPVSNKGDGVDNGARSEFDVMEAGTYLVVVRGDGTETGTYTVRASDITSEEAYGDFTSGFIGGRLKIDDTNAMTGAVGHSSDYDWYLALLEDGKCYTFHAKGWHSNSNHVGGTLNDPKIKLMKFYDYYEKKYYNLETGLYERPDPLTTAYFETVYVDPAKFVNISQADEVCFISTLADDPDRQFCNYYCDDDGGPGNNAKLQVHVKAGGGGDYLLAVYAADRSKGTYSLHVEETTCPSD